MNPAYAIQDTSQVFSPALLFYPEFIRRNIARAIEIAEGEIPNTFLRAFTKPVRNDACDCARETEPSLNQVIHLVNNADLLAKAQRSPAALDAHVRGQIAHVISTREGARRIAVAETPIDATGY